MFLVLSTNVCGGAVTCVGAATFAAVEHHLCGGAATCAAVQPHVRRTAASAAVQPHVQRRRRLCNVQPLCSSAATRAVWQQNIISVQQRCDSCRLVS